jgi:penicillin V acylase-like amidase (Ntn superfamily)
MHGLPGDFTPPSRFVRAVAFSQAAIASDTAQQSVLQCRLWLVSERNVWYPFTASLMLSERANGIVSNGVVDVPESVAARDVLN